MYWGQSFSVPGKLEEEESANGHLPVNVVTPKAES
jgi:hypothetical protein